MQTKAEKASLPISKGSAPEVLQGSTAIRIKVRKGSARSSTAKTIAKEDAGAWVHVCPVSLQRVPKVVLAAIRWQRFIQAWPC